MQTKRDLDQLKRVISEAKEGTTLVLCPRKALQVTLSFEHLPLELRDKRTLEKMISEYLDEQKQQGFIKVWPGTPIRDISCCFHPLTGSHVCVRTAQDTSWFGGVKAVEFWEASPTPVADEPMAEQTTWRGKVIAPQRALFPLPR